MDHKYVPKAGDDYKKIHALHLQHLADVVAANKKAREKVAQNPDKPHAQLPQSSNPAAKEANSTQPVVSGAPQNPDNPVNQPAGLSSPHPADTVNK